ncbi:MAG: NAD(P)-dependent oxidoreductase [Gammaproteobacteria bacterium]|jgi:NAD(P)-dependent dehydrogenase (short-subunit alcohol dehydrogenase family)|nr:NAD(P)-dependent oxidoreductase [Gammaproteobacteria bacterium]|tara:strand:- start:609 stop:1391 length:783 start_codon:yes stop_codon:yes gene_type:complete
MSKIILVTGGSRGIGAAICRTAGKAGYDVAVNYVSAQDKADEVVEDIKKEGQRAIAVKANMGKEEDILAMLETVDAELGPVTDIVNNAAIDYETLIPEMKTEGLRNLFDTNVIGLFIIAREAVKRMSKKINGVGGNIVNVGSISSRYGGLPGDVVYAATKGAVDSMTKGLAHEYADHGIRVNCVRPGFVLTDIWENSIGVEKANEIAKTGSMLKRMGQPEEIADMVLWLCSDKASYVTSAIFDVDGGRSNRINTGSVDSR